MPIRPCQRKGKKGYRWGNQKCYIGPGAKRKAQKQAAAIRASGWTENYHLILNASTRRDPTRLTMLRKRFELAMSVRFDRLKKAIQKLVDEDDVFGLKERKHEVKDLFTENAEHQYGSTQVNITDPEVISLVRQLQNHVLASDRIENENTTHITILYGLRDTGQMARCDGVFDTGPVRVKLGKLSLFTNEDADVLKIDVESPDLQALHEKLKVMDHVETHAVFHPHLTIAYLKPGTGIKYVGEPSGLEGKELVFESFVLSSQDGNRVEISLLDGSKKEVENEAAEVRFSGRDDSDAVLDFNCDHVSGRVGDDRSVGGEGSVLSVLTNTNTLITNDRWRFLSKPEQVDAFQAWLEQQIDLTVLGVQAGAPTDAFWKAYIEEGFRKGGLRSFDDFRKSATKTTQKQLDFFAGTKEEFLRQSFVQPVAREKVELLTSRVYTELKGVTSAMSQKIKRTLVDGLVQGQSPWEVARQMSKDVDGIGKNRAKTIARTETTRAHAEGQLESMERMGVEELGVMVEWTVSGLGITGRGNPSPCALCAPLDKTVLTLKEAKGLLPRHPGCICAFRPANILEDTKGQKRKQSSIQRAILGSVGAERPKRSKRSIATQRKLSSWVGAGKRISKVRPKSIFV